MQAKADNPPDHPGISPVMHIRPEWIDYNGHLNLAYYQVLFDTNIDRVFDAVGLGKAYVDRTGHSFFAAEVHLVYKREVKLTDPVRVTFRVLDLDDKRLHFYSELHHAEEGWLSCCSENLSLHVDLGARKVAPFLPEARRILTGLRDADAALPLPEVVGRRIAMPERRPG